MASLAHDDGRDRSNRFYVYMAAACVLLAFGAFSPTYWLQLPAGTFVGPPILHIHGILFSAWTLLLLWQAWLVASGRLARHRAFGLAGISLATAMVVVGLVAAIGTLSEGLAAGYGDRSRAFLALPISTISLFAGFFTAAIFNIRSPEAHKRLILLATISLLQAAMGRVFFALIVGVAPGARPGLGPPAQVAFAIVPSLVLELFIVAGVIYDWRTRGRPHRVWLIGAAIITAVVFLRVPLSMTPAWRTFADAMAHITG